MGQGHASQRHGNLLGRIAGRGMNLHAKLLQREADKRPIRIGLIGAGKFGSMYLAQIPKTPGVHLVLGSSCQRRQHLHF
jgi:predicted homoserine dehydrogenase-like protein